MPNPPGRRALLVIAALAFAALLVGLVQARRAPPPIVIQTPAGTTLPPVPVSAPPTPTAQAASAALPPPVAPAPVAVAAVPKPQAAALIYVHVAGAVKHPSLYQLPDGSRVWHAIKAAGGPSANADENAVNLAAKVHDGEKVYVPTKASQAHPAPAPQEAAFAAPTPAAAVPVQSARAPARGKAQGAAAGAGKPAKLVSAAQGQVNINTASTEQLQELPGIGPAMAGRIIGYRQQTGGFQKPEDLMSVGGIGPKKFARISPLIKLH